MIAAIYARKSTDQSGVADEQKSVARQIDHARAYAIRKGWQVDEASIFVDDGISGAEFANRPGFLRLMNALKPRAPFQVLVMSEESRLGREAIETAYALKQLVTAGVRVFFYLEDRERTLESPTDKIMLSLTAFADELEREKARQRTYDAMVRKARAGHVTGGRVFGYDNIDVAGAGGTRSHVERCINEGEAAVVRRLFELSAAGHGVKAIAKTLNAEGASSPRAQLGRSQTWAPSSVRAVLHRNLYRGVMTWNRTRKRNQWGAHKQAARPSSDWLEILAPTLRIVSEELWQAAHRRAATARQVYLKGTQHQPFGRPALGTPAKYLLTGLAYCGCCGNTLIATSRSHGRVRVPFYACAGHHQRGPTVCGNRRVLPMGEGNAIVIESLLDDVLDLSMLTEAVDEALDLLMTDSSDERLEVLDGQLVKISRERDRLVAAIAAGGQLAGLLDALQAREQERARVEAEQAAVRAQAPLRASDARRVRGELLTLAASWRTVLADDPSHARPIVSSLLKGRVTFTPMDHPKEWEVRGAGTLVEMFSRLFVQGVIRPQRDSNPCFGLESEKEPQTASGDSAPKIDASRDEPES
jgi:DNA invertase Pin-like site-specific DNA recombinase